MISGVYSIKNTVNGKMYIGSSSNIPIRTRAHKYYLRIGKHHSQKLQRAWAKYGQENFEFATILFCEKDKLAIYEQIALDRYKVYEPALGYNICPKARSVQGRKHTEETKKKMSRSAKLRVVPRCQIERLRSANLGSKLPPERCARISQALKERQRSPESYIKAKITRSRTILLNPRIITPETRAKLSASGFKAWEKRKRSTEGGNHSSIT